MICQFALIQHGRLKHIYPRRFSAISVLSVTHEEQLEHYVCSNQEQNRTKVDAVVSQRALREVYLKAFETSVKTGAYRLSIEYIRAGMQVRALTFEKEQ